MWIRKCVVCGEVFADTGLRQCPLVGCRGLMVLEQVVTSQRPQPPHIGQGLIKLEPSLGDGTVKQESSVPPQLSRNDRKPYRDRRNSKAPRNDRSRSPHLDRKPTSTRKDGDKRKAPTGKQGDAGPKPKIWCLLHHVSGHKPDEKCVTEERKVTIPVRAISLFWRDLPDGWRDTFVQTRPEPTNFGEFLDQLSYANRMLTDYVEFVKARDAFLWRIGQHLRDHCSLVIYERWLTAVNYSCWTTEHFCKRMSGVVNMGRRQVVLDPIRQLMAQDPNCPRPKNEAEGHSASDTMKWLMADFSHRAPTVDWDAYDQFVAAMRDVRSDLQADLQRLTHANMQVAVSSDEILASPLLKLAFLAPVSWVIRPAEEEMVIQLGMHLFFWPQLTPIVNKIKQIAATT